MGNQCYCNNSTTQNEFSTVVNQEEIFKKRSNFIIDQTTFFEGIEEENERKLKFVREVIAKG